jgi:16S rRNA C967 or C1407 C5-methylase (RsmB/RsmF family)
LANSVGEERAKNVCQTMNERAPLTVRANLLKTSREELFNTFKRKGFSVRKTDYSPYGIQFLAHPKVTIS